MLNHQRILDALQMAEAGFATRFREELKLDGCEIIEVDGKVFRTFNDKRWLISSFLARRDKTVFVALIAAKKPRRGYFRDLVTEIEAAGYDVAVLTPLREMAEIITAWGFKQGRAFLCGEVQEVWRR